MHKIFWTEQAKQDLEHIYAFIAKDSDNFANVVLSAILEKVTVFHGSKLL